jgi:hypothetical protein
MVDPSVAHVKLLSEFIYFGFNYLGYLE